MHSSKLPAAFRNRTFWHAFILTAMLVSLTFAWELNFLAPAFPGPPRPKVVPSEFLFIVVLVLLLSLNVGLIRYQSKQGSCPTGTKKALGLAGSLGVVTLLCPVCLLLPISLFGLSVSLYVLSPFLPLMRVVVLILLGVSTVMLWPKK